MFGLNNRHFTVATNIVRILQIHGRFEGFKAYLSFYRITPKNTQMTTLYTILPLCITFTMIYYIRHFSILLNSYMNSYV